MNIFSREMKANRKSLIIWCVSMSLLIISGMSKFEVISGTGQSMQEIWSMMPKSLVALMGTGSLDISTAIGFYGVLYLFILITAAIHAVMLGATIISKEERDKTSEFLLVKPVSRERVITEKLSAAFLNVIILNILTLVSSIGIINYYSKIPVNSNDIVMLMVGLFIIQLIFLSIGTGIAAVSKNPKTAPSVATMILLFTYIISAIIDLNPTLGNLKFIAPFKYFEASNLLMGKGFEPAFMILSIFIIAVFSTMTYLFYKRRDLNV